MSPIRKILHLDLDAFFCSVEELRDPSLRGKPFAVGGKPDERGVVSSCSYPARKLGIHSAMPMAQAVKLVPNLIIISGHFKDYSAKSKQVMNRLIEFSPSVEQISIDEAFLDISNHPGTSDEIARAIQGRINEELNLPCSIGIASNKLVAKIATDYGKACAIPIGGPPNAIFIVPPGKEAEFLASLPVDALLGVGPKTSATLKQKGIKTIGDIANIPETKLIEQFGKLGYELSRQAQGIDDRPIAIHHTIKSISQERTFPKDIRDKETLLSTLSYLSEHVSLSLKKKHLDASTLKIKIRWANFETFTRQLTLVSPVNNSKDIYQSVEKLFLDNWNTGQPIRLIGVGASNLIPEQLRLWDIKSSRTQFEKDRRLKSAITELRDKFGDQALLWGNEFNNK